MVNEDVENFGYGCGFDSFKEIEETRNLISELSGAINVAADFRVMERNRERFQFILTQYQDQPHLLDPYLEGILQSLLGIIKNEEIDVKSKHYVFKYLFIIMSVKTYKKIVTYLPHEVMDLLPVLRMLENQDPNDVETWETRYVLLVWLSIISKIPFPLSRLETSENLDPEDTIIMRILKLCKLYCTSKDACSVAAVFLISNFLTRSDVKKLNLKEMIDWCLDRLEKDPLKHGPLAVLASILKHNSREDLKPYAQMLLDKMLKLQLNKCPADLSRKFGMKVFQRIGFVLLKTKVATWRYQKASRPINLLPNIQNRDFSSENVADTKDETLVDNENENDEQDIPPAIEEIIEQLIQGLRDKTITIRWSAAKGIGRITARLPVDLADEVVGFVLNLFSGRESDSAWHGGCLALAELCRRGLLLPHRLKDVIPVVLQALVFDEPRAYGSVGSIIRDAACYVCWSFARAFDPHIFEPHVKEVSANLLIVTCFDREINCRRAASAAFQENVGRQGNFPHGIDILTVADYFEVGVRSNSYLKISVFIAQFEEYTRPLIDHLVTRKITHWDTAIRELAAKALHNLTASDPRYIIETILPDLLDNINSIDLNVRHGTILAIGEILEALYHHEKEESIESVIGIPSTDGIRRIIATLRSRGQFRGLGGELMKQSCTILIRKCSLIHFPIHSHASDIEDWQNLLEECLTHEVLIVKLKSAEAHGDFFQEYYRNADSGMRNVIVDRYLASLKSSNQSIRIGFAQAIGHFPLFVLRERTKDIIEALITCSHITEESLKWAESRKEALKSLTLICQTLGVKESETWKPFIRDLYRCYLLALKEYTTDSRGDIGAWVREAAMSGLHDLTNLISQSDLTSSLNETLMSSIIGGIAQQAVERIDKIRFQAGTIFSALIHSKRILPNIPYHDELKQIFPLEECQDQIDWKMESVTFPKFIKMLEFQPYVDSLLRGIIFSVGGLSESLVKHSSVSLFSYFKEIDEKKLQNLCNHIVDIFDDSHGDERMISSMLAFLDRLMSSGCIQVVLDDSESEVPQRILTLLKREYKYMKNTKLQTSSIKVFCQLLQVRGWVSKKAFSQLCICLCNKFQCLRKATAIRLYEALTLYGEDMDISEENLAEILTILNNTDWEQPVDVLRPFRNQLCQLMNIPAPVLQPKK